MTKEYLYDAFGNERSPDANDANPFRYCGEYFDAETGDIYLRARYYRPATGRFITEDPTLSGLNWYIYCNNSPLVFIDPLELFTAGDRLYKGGTNNVEDVKQLQSALNALGGDYYCGNVDGIFGDKTLRAVNLFKDRRFKGGNLGRNRGVVGTQTSV